MKKIQILVNGEHACYLAARSKRDALERIHAAQEQKAGALWDVVKKFPEGLPVSTIDLGRL